MKTSRLLRSPLLMLVGVLALFLSAGPGSLSAQTDTETKIRLMADALRARDSGDLVAAEDSLRQLAAMAPGDATLHRLLESIISLLDAGPASAYVASAAFDFDDEAEALASAETGRLESLVEIAQADLREARDLATRNNYAAALALIATTAGALPANPLYRRRACRSSEAERGGYTHPGPIPAQAG